MSIVLDDHQPTQQGVHLILINLHIRANVVMVPFQNIRNLNLSFSSRLLLIGLYFGWVTHFSKDKRFQELSFGSFYQFCFERISPKVWNGSFGQNIIQVKTSFLKSKQVVDNVSFQVGSFLEEIRWIRMNQCPCNVQIMISDALVLDALEVYLQLKPEELIGVVSSRILLHGFKTKVKHHAKHVLDLFRTQLTHIKIWIQGSLHSDSDFPQS